MAESVRAESVERKERVRQLAIEHMEQESSFPTARAIQTKFFEHQYPGNLGSISTDLKEVAKDISLVYRSKQTVDIDGDKIEIPKEALEYAVRSYQIIELQQMKKYDTLKQVALVEVDKAKQELTDLNGKYYKIESDLEAKIKLLEMREEQLQEMKEKMSVQEKEMKEAQAKARELENTNNQLSSELTATKKHLDDQHIQHENEIKRLDAKTINLNNQYQNLNTENQQLKSENDKLSYELTITVKEKDSLTESNSQFETKNTTLVNDLSGLKASNNALAEERNIQKKQIDELRDVIEGLQGKVQSFEGHLQNLSGARH